MPTEGVDQNPYPNTTDAPDGPGAFLALAQRITAMKGAGVAYAATNAVRVALQASDAFAGLLVYDAQDDAYYKWTGAAWIRQMYPLVSSVYQSVSSTALLTSATTLGTAQAFAAVPFASTVEALFVGWVSNTSAGARTPVSDVGISGSGTATTGVDGFGFGVSATSTLPVTIRGVFTVPANTAATVTIAAHIASAASSVLFAGGILFKQLPA